MPRIAIRKATHHRPDPANPTITDMDLLEVQTRRQRLDLIQREAAEAAAEVAEWEARIIAKLRAGAECTGELVACLNKVSTGVRPRWKEEYVLHMTTAHDMSEKKAEEQVRSKYPEGYCEQLVIAPKRPEAS